MDEREIRGLLEQGGNLDAVDGDGKTPLVQAAEAGAWADLPRED